MCTYRRGSNWVIVDWSRGDGQNRRHIRNQGPLPAKWTTKMQTLVLGCLNLIYSETAASLSRLRSTSMGLNPKAARPKSIASPMLSVVAVAMAQSSERRCKGLPALRKSALTPEARS